MKVYIEVNRVLESDSRGKVWYAYSELPKSSPEDYSAFISYDEHITLMDEKIRDILTEFKNLLGKS